jgi:hypothetical protein
MKRLTELAVRLRVISTSLLSILGFISLGVLVGLWLGYRTPAVGPAPRTADEPSSRIPANLKWCDPTHTVPYISAAACGGGSSCERASMSFGEDHTDWNAFCANLTKQLTQ